ncbi:MAG: hypothetical protein JJT94_06570 [Bernardetiaceae bacterium]|nr:hypothetical protein [Bernardetiaceae bacterium]
MGVKSIWLTYDLGIKGDYPSLYAWLDNHDAKEAGNNTAFLQYEFDGEDKDFFDNLTNDLKSFITFKSGDRIYVIAARSDEGTKKIGGRFIIGNRKANPWKGYGQKVDNVIDGDE